MLQSYKVSVNQQQIPPWLLPDDIKYSNWHRMNSIQIENIKYNVWTQYYSKKQHSVALSVMR